MSIPGQMTQQWTIWCKSCAGNDQVSGNKSQATAEFKKSGWMIVAGRAYCPACAKEAKDSETVERVTLLGRSK